MDSDLKQGEVVFTSCGQEVRFYSYVNGDQALVEYGFQDYDGNRYFEGFHIETEVFRKSPTKLMDERIVRLNEEIQKLQVKLYRLRTEVHDAENKHSERMKKFSKYDALKNIEDFIEGKITHYVEIRYGQARIISIKEARCNCDRQDQRLLSLYGKSNGDLEWHLHEYRDHSGSHWQVFPCLSFEEAVNMVIKYIEDRCEEARKDPSKSYFSYNIIKTAKEIGYVVPDDIIKMAQDHEKECMKKKYIDSKKVYDQVLEEYLKMFPEDKISMKE